MLLAILAKSVQKMGEGFGTLFGTFVHLDFAARVKGHDLPGVGAKGVEQSFHLGEFVRFGVAGSIRTDIVLKDKFGNPVAIYDLKTGNARLTRSRLNELRAHVGVPDIPIIELRYREGTALLR
jgi:hypothetical protein